MRAYEQLPARARTTEIEIELAEARLRAGDLFGAADANSAAIRKGGESARTLCIKAEILAADNEPQMAIARLREALQNDPSCKPAITMLAQLLAGQQRLKTDVQGETVLSAGREQKDLYFDCTHAFLDHDYERSAELSRRLMAQRFRHRTVCLIHLVSLQRLGSVATAGTAERLLRETLDSSWDHALIELTLGIRTSAEMLIRATDDEMRCQVHYYSGCRRLTLGDDNGAEAEFLKAVDARSMCFEHNFATDEFRYRVQVLIRSAEQSADRGDLQDALQLGVRSLEVAKRTLPEDHPTTARAIRALSDVCGFRGLYEDADRLSLEALEKSERIFGESALDTIKALNSRASALRAIGNLSGAEAAFRKALRILEVHHGKENAVYATVLNNMAEMMLAQHVYETAEVMLIEAIGIRTRLSLEDGGLANALNNISEVYRATGRRDEAAERLREALRIRIRVSGGNHPHVASSMTNLAIAWMEMGKYQDEHVEMLLREAVTIRQKQLGTIHPEYAISVSNLAHYYLLRGRAQEALRLLDHSESINDRFIEASFFLPNEDMNRRLLHIRCNLFIYISVALHHPGPDIARSALNLCLRSRGIGLETDMLARNKNTFVESLRRETQATVQQLEHMNEIVDLVPEVEEERQKLQVKIQNAMAVLEETLPKMRLWRMLGEATCEQVARQLPRGGALVEFVKFWAVDTTQCYRPGPHVPPELRYAAFVLREGDGTDVRMFDLGPAKKIDDAVADFRRSIENHEAPDIEPVVGGRTRTWGQDLRSMVFDPLRAAIGESQDLVIAPDGNLYLVPFAVLGSADGRFLGDHYDLTYVSVGREVLRFGHRRSGEPGPSMVIADPDFDFRSQTPVASLAPGSVEFQAQARLRNVGMTFEALPGTIVEAETVGQLLGVEPLVGKAALESRVKVAQCPRILHIATHGFFVEHDELDSALVQRLAGLSPKGEGSASTEVEKQPLRLSGLAFAGANTWLRFGCAPEEREDGLLHALDVAELNLAASELIVLSACDTGLGMIFDGEGVFGLRRGFALAGARRLIMSLWKVPDVATAVLMESFYQNLLAARLPCAIALKNAQIQMRELTIGDLRKSWLSTPRMERLCNISNSVGSELQWLASLPDDIRPFSCPMYWGAFIHEGDPKPLDE